MRSTCPNRDQPVITDQLVYYVYKNYLFDGRTDGRTDGRMYCQSLICWRVVDVCMPVYLSVCIIIYSLSLSLSPLSWCIFDVTLTRYRWGGGIIDI